MHQIAKTPPRTVESHTVYTKVKSFCVYIYYTMNPQTKILTPPLPPYIYQKNKHLHNVLKIKHLPVINYRNNQKFQENTELVYNKDNTHF